MHKISKQDLMTYIEEGKETPVIITDDGWDLYALINMDDYETLMEAKELMADDAEAAFYNSKEYRDACEKFITIFNKLFGPDTEKMN